MKQLFLFLMLILLGTSLVSAGGTSKTNRNILAIDNDTAVRTVDITSADIPVDETISNVTAMIDFHKTNGECNAKVARLAFSDEIGFVLESPAGTQVNLVYSLESTNRSYTNQVGIPPRVQVTFDDNAVSIVGVRNAGVPRSGTFRPAEPLSTFIGEYPHGRWRLFMTDTDPLDPLCFYGFTLNVLTIPGNIQISAQPMAVTENITSVYSVWLKTIPAAPVTITATPTGDCQLNNQPPGTPVQVTLTDTAPREIRVSVADDFLWEPGRNCTIAHTSSSADPAYNARAIRDQLVNILDDDVPAVEFDKLDLTTSEDRDRDTVGVTLASIPSGPVTVTLAVDDDTEGRVTTTTLNFAPSTFNVPQYVTVVGRNDPVDDPNSEFLLNATASGAAEYVGVTASLKVTNQDNEEALTVGFRCEDENLAINIISGDGPFDITTSSGINMPVLDVSKGILVINGPERWDNLTITETTRGFQSINFGTLKCLPLATPSPMVPAQRERLTDPTPLFRWTAVPNANRYRVIVFDNADPNLQTVDIRQNTPDNTRALILETPLSPGRYFWRVRARVNSVWSRWGARGVFFIEAPTLDLQPQPTLELSTPVIIPTMELPTEEVPTIEAPTEVPPTDAPPTDIPPTDTPPTEIPPTEVPPTSTLPVPPNSP